MRVCNTMKIFLFKLIRLHTIVEILVEAIFESTNEINKIHIHFYIVSFIFNSIKIIDCDTTVNLNFSFTLFISFL